MRVLIKGAGVAGLASAYALTGRGFDVEVVETASAVGLGASFCAGGMLAPWCEGETADMQVVEAGKMSIGWWDEALPGLVRRNGTLVVAQARDVGELERFARRTSNFEWLDERGVASIEPALEGRFRRGLLFRDEAHIDPRAALAGLYRRLESMGVRFHFDSASAPPGPHDCIIDCTGSAAISGDRSLRGVRGEMLYLKTDEISLSRPVRLLHPRIPFYVAPQPGSRFMVGATMIESDDNRSISSRSMLELLNSAYALHPAFGEAEIIETGTGIRPAYPDNVPRVTTSGRNVSVNGMYRHGFLMAPWLAEQLAQSLSIERMRKEAV